RRYTAGSGKMRFRDRRPAAPACSHGYTRCRTRLRDRDTTRRAVPSAAAAITSPTAFLRSRRVPVKYGLKKVPVRIGELRWTTGRSGGSVNRVVVNRVDNGAA